MNKTDSDDIYNLMLKQLKKALGTEEPNLGAIRLGLEFIKMFSLEEELKGSDVETFISSLPFKDE